MAYTQEQINGMTLEQLRNVVLELQGQQAVIESATDTSSAVQADIDKIEAKIASLKEDGEELYSDAISALEAKRDELVAKAKAEIQEVETEVNTFVEQFRDKYLPWVEGAAIVIVLLKIFNVI